MAKAIKTITVENIKGRDSVRFGRNIPGPSAMGHHAEIIVGVSIRLHGVETNRKDGPLAYDHTFKFGDVAEYDSYNMHYTGRIVSIGEKTIGILPEGSDRVRRLELYEFSYRNRDLDLDAIAARNLDVMASC
jgi:hypothetical protein